MVVKCHHHGISRLRAEELLMAAKEDGSFLVRDSETIHGAYTLCLLHQGRVHQYRVLPDASGKIFVQAERGVQERKFSDLESLVKDYLTRRSRNGLMCALRHPVAIQEPLDDDSEDEEEDEGQIKVMHQDEGKIKVIDQDEGPLNPQNCYSRVPPSASSSGSSSGSNLSLDRAQKPLPTVQTNGHSGEIVSSVRTAHDKLPAPGLHVKTTGLLMLEHNKQTPLTPDYTDIDNVSSENNPVCRYIVSNYAALDLLNCDSRFSARLRDYRDNGVYKDSAAASGGETQLAQLRNLLTGEAKDLDKHLESFLNKIDICRQLFGPLKTPILAGGASNEDVSPNLDTLLDKLLLCRMAIPKLEKKAMHQLSEWMLEGSVPEPVLHGPPLPVRGSKEPPVIPTSSFEAKLSKSGKLSASHRVTLKVDIHSGKLFMVRPSKETLDDSNVFNHDKVVQIIKSTTNNCRLDIRIDGRKGKDTIVFDHVRQRESFCQLLQQMKYMHSAHEEVDRLSLFIGAWNMGDESPPCDMHNWLRCQGLGKPQDETLAVLAHDMYVIGTQESALTEKDWVNRLQRTLSECVQTDLQLLSSSTLWGIRLVILVKPQLKNKITHIQQSTVKTGIANALGNKGASAISFSFNGTSFCFVNCHLTSGFEKNHRRNQNCHDIIKGLNLGTKALSLFDITNQFHHVFFLGDLNYRIDGIEPLTIIEKIRNEEYKELLQYDQLKNSQERNECLVGFMEEEITFPPTYRIARGSKDKYEWQKFKKTGLRINAPSWCDRVMRKSYPETYIINTSYGCVDTITTSDHKPVFSSFHVGIINQFAGSTTPSNGGMSIIFEEVHAEVRTSTKEQFKLEFFSSCLEAPVVSNHSWEFDEPKPCFCCPRWNAAQISQMYPLVQDRDYLEDLHILIAVKSADGMESYGECVVALKSMFADQGQPFMHHLTHLGEETGTLTGKMYVKSKDDNSKRRGRKSFELIYMDTDQLFQSRETLLKNQKPDLMSLSKIDDRNLSLGVSKTVLCKTKSLQPDPGRSESLSAGTDCKDVDGGAMAEARIRNSYESIWLKQTGAASKSQPGEMKPYSNVDASSPPPTANFKSAAEAAKLTPIPRQPKLGQSSLKPSTVLPATTMTSLTQASPSSLHDLPSMEYECVSYPGARHVDLNLNVSKSKETPNLSKSKEVPNVSKSREVPNVSKSREMPVDQPPQSATKRTALVDSEMLVRDNPFYEETDKPRNRLSSTSSIEPPPTPERRYLDTERQSCTYDVLRAPSTVSQWLTDLGLPQYIPQFLSHGWDHLDFVTDLTEHQLTDMAIRNTGHQAKILKSTANLRDFRDSISDA